MIHLSTKWDVTHAKRQLEVRFHRAVWIRQVETRIQVAVWYDPEFIRRAKELGGYWRYRSATWTFSRAEPPDILAILHASFGSDVVIHGVLGDWRLTNPIASTAPVVSG